MKGQPLKNTLRDKFTQADFDRIREETKTQTYRELAKKYKIGISTIHKIATGKLWLK